MTMRLGGISGLQQFSPALQAGKATGLMKRSDSGLMFQDVPNVGSAPTLAAYQPFSFSQTLAGQAPSEWERLVSDRAKFQGLTPETMRQIDFGRASAQGGAMQGMSQLARSGGLQSGSRERLINAARQQSALGQQEAGFQQQQRQEAAQTGLMGLSEERNRIDLGNAFNTQLQNQQGLNQYNLAKYNTEYQDYSQQKALQAAALQAAQQEKLQATRGGLLGSGGFLGSGFKF